MARFNLQTLRTLLHAIPRTKNDTFGFSTLSGVEQNIFSETLKINLNLGNTK